MGHLYGILKYLKIPIRNIWKNRRRTFITIASICVGTITLLVFTSYMNTMFIGLKYDAIHHQYGNIQIVKKGYFLVEENSPYIVMKSNDIKTMERELDGMKDVDYYNERLCIVGLIGNMERSTFFSGIAGFPEIESMMTPDILKGNVLSDNDPSGIVVGKALADKIGLKVGDNVILLVNSEGGSQEAINASIRGIYSSVIREMESVIIYLPIKLAWQLTLEQKVHRILVFLKSDNPGNTDAALKELQKGIDKNKLDLEVKPWGKLAVFYNQIVGMFTGMDIIIGFILFLIVIFNISNTMQMSINDRMKEIGTLRAMGSSRSEIVQLFTIEGIIMGIIGASIGVAAAMIAFPIINHSGVYLPPSPGQDKPLIVYFTMDLNIILTIFLVDFITAFLASYFPARRGSKIKIVNALRDI